MVYVINTWLLALSFRVSHNPANANKEPSLKPIARLLRLCVDLGPFIKPFRGDEAPPVFHRFAECWAGGNRFRLRIDRGEANL